MTRTAPRRTWLLLAVVAWRLDAIRSLRRLPELERESDWLGLEADVRPTGS